MQTAPEAYELDDHRLDELEARVVAMLAVGAPDRVVACAFVDGGSPLAAFGRTLEARSFPGYDFAQALAVYEDRSIFVYTVDVEVRRIAHVKRMVLPLRHRGADGRTGIEVLDDRLRAEDPKEQADLDDILRHHQLADVHRCVNLTTSMGTERGVRPTRARPYSLLGYRALFEWGVTRHYDHLFAYVNRGTVRSIGRLGITGGLLLDREFHLPDPRGGYDLDYVAVHLDGGPRSVEVFTVGDPAFPLSGLLAAIDLPVVIIADDDDVVIDLRDSPSGPVQGADDDVVIDLRDDPTAPMPDPSSPSRPDRLS